MCLNYVYYSIIVIVRSNIMIILTANSCIISKHSNLWMLQVARIDTCTCIQHISTCSLISVCTYMMGR